MPSRDVLSAVVDVPTNRMLGSKRRGGPHSLPLHDPGRGSKEQSLKGTDVV